MKCKKIDLYFAGDYYCSTNQAKTCREAKKKLLERIAHNKHTLGGIGLLEKQILKNPTLLKARFDKDALR